MHLVAILGSARVIQRQYRKHYWTPERRERRVESMLEQMEALRTGPADHEAVFRYIVLTHRMLHRVYERTLPNRLAQNPIVYQFFDALRQREIQRREPHPCFSPVWKKHTIVGLRAANAQFQLRRLARGEEMEADTTKYELYR